jgi:hypothetical protein
VHAATRSILFPGALTVAALLPSACGSWDPRAKPCGIEAPVVREFALEHARDYRTALPRMGRSPELEIDIPAYVVVYAGPLNLGGVMRAPDGQDASGNPIGHVDQPDSATGVVCVVVNGAPTIYVNVDASSGS